MFKIQPIKSCPHSRKSQGIVLMQPSLIAELAAAVTDKDEWAILLHGERRKGGYEVEVTHYSIPPQKRSGGHVDIAEFDLDASVVGVIHSHHHLGAFFSTIDTSTLNPRFPVSIVVAHGATTYLGFDYKGTGKVQLPCGSTGEIEFRIQPTEGPVVAEIAQVTHDALNLGDCNRYVDHGDQFYVEYEAACGLKEPRVLKAKAFGTEATLLDAVAKLDRPAVVGIGSKCSKQSQGTGTVQLGEITSIPAEDEYWCHQHQDWDTCYGNKNGGDTADKGWLGKYEAIAERQSESSTNGGIDQLTYCDDCALHAPFMDWSCENCGAPYCMTCEDGHTGPCSEQEDGLCRCGTKMDNDYIYCSERCKEYFEPVGGVVVDGVEGEQLTDGSIIVVG